jgi:hypothetical protein
MNRNTYIVYALIIVLATLGLNSHLESGVNTSYRSWGNSSGFHTGSGSNWGGSGHK